LPLGIDEFFEDGNGMAKTKMVNWNTWQISPEYAESQNWGVRSVPQRIKRTKKLG